MREPPANVEITNDLSIEFEQGSADEEPFVNLLSVTSRNIASISLWEVDDCRKVAAALNDAADWLESLEQ
jgi:hypothetical protein